MTGDPTPAPPLQRTPLFGFHQRHHAHLVPFAGWEMPLYYTSILDEHRAVRSGAGLFDVSHMGILTVEGGGSEALLSRRTTANVAKLEPGQVRYTFLLEATGRIVDDLLITRLDAGEEVARRHLVVPNAGRAAEIEEILRQHRGPETIVKRWNGTVALLALQGPRSRTILERKFGWDLSRVGFYRSSFFPADEGTAHSTGRIGLSVPAGLAQSILVSRTGYTGELGYELFVEAARVDALAESLVAEGAQPVGLGARDTLRLEKGYLLSGQEFHRDRTPLEAAQDRFVEFDHRFVGEPALAQQKADGPAIRLVGIEVTEAGAIPRHGTPVLVAGERVAEATSGGLSPGLGHGIALAYLPRAHAAAGTAVTLDLRGRSVAGRVVALPFVRAPSAKGN